MPKFSLKELLYWWTICILFVSGLTALTATPLALFVVCLWLFGVAAIGKVFGDRFSFICSTFIGFLINFPILVHPVGTRARIGPDYTTEAFAISVLFGLISGSMIWLLALVLDKLEQRLIRPD